MIILFINLHNQILHCVLKCLHKNVHIKSKYVPSET